MFGPEVGRHARSAIAGLPFNIAVEIEGEVLAARMMKAAKSREYIRRAIAPLSPP